MSDPDSSSAPDPLEAAASVWLARLDRGLTQQEQDEYLQWLRDDPRHGRALVRLQQTWSALDLLSEWQPKHSPVPNPDLLAQPEPPVAQRPTRRRWPVWSAATLIAAALLVLIYVVNWPAPLAATRSPQHFVTAVGMLQTITMEDGSVAQLNTDTAIAVEQLPGERRVQLLRGEAHFTVAADRARPFRVYAQGVVVQDISTAFSVRVRPDGVEVLVSEGGVRVEPPAETGARVLPYLAARQRALVPLKAGQDHVVTLLQPDQLERALAWREGRLDFLNTPLADVVAEFNRYSRRQLSIRDPELAALRFEGRFSPHDPDAFVRLLKSAYAVEAEATDDTELVLHRLAPP